jgi:ABC-type sugar transport system permease subunit
MRRIFPSITHCLAFIAQLPDTLLGRLDDIFDRLRHRGLGDWPLVLLLLSPALLILSVFVLFPMGSTFYMSLFGGRHGMGDFVGMSNYLAAFQKPEFRSSLLVTIYYVLGVVPLSMFISFLIAYGLYKITLGRGLLRTIYFLPYITSAVAAAMVWRAIFSPQSGVINLLLGYVGVEPLNWLLEPRGALFIFSDGLIPASWGPSLGLVCIILFDVWHGCGFMIVVFLAGLTAMPRELEEAARIDGANSARILWHVTLPLLSPTIFFLLIVSVIKSFQAFNSFYALTHGVGMPGVQNLILYLYVQFYEYGYWGYGATIATLLMTAIVLLTLIQWRLLGRKVHYS